MATEQNIEDVRRYYHNVKRQYANAAYVENIARVRMGVTAFLACLIADNSVPGLGAGLPAEAVEIPFFGAKIVLDTSLEPWGVETDAPEQKEII